MNRAERRRIAHRFGPPAPPRTRPVASPRADRGDPGRLTAGYMLLARYAMAEALEPPRPLPRVLAVVRHATGFAVELIAQMRAGDDVALDCKEGCAHCCYLRVSVTPPEVVRLGAWLRVHLDDAQRADLLARAQAAHALTADLSGSAQWDLQVPCPLLDVGTGRCTAYEARPLMCVGHTSTDVRACIPGGTLRAAGYWPQERAAQGFASGLTLGAHDAGVDGRPLELAAALAVVLADPEAGAKWRAGDLTVFASAVNPGALQGEPFENYVARQTAALPRRDAVVQATAALARWGIDPRDVQRHASRLVRDAETSIPR